MSVPVSQPPCEEWSAMLHGLVDGELDAVHTVRSEEHVATCAGCAAELARLRALRRILGHEEVHWRAPDHLRARIVADVMRYADAPARQPSGARVRGGGWFTAALQRWSLVSSLAILAASLIIVLAPLDRDGQLTEDLVAGHVRSLQADHLTDVASSNQHVVKPWFIGKLDFAMPVIDLVEKGFPLIGGRVDYIDQRVVAALVYKRHSHIINLFVWPADSAGSKTLMRSGYNLMNWTQGGLTFWAVTDLNVDELRQFQVALAAASPK